MSDPSPRSRSRSRSLAPAVGVSAVLLSSMLGGVHVAPSSAQAPADPSVSALTRALDRRMTVWSTETRTIYVSHCRAARGGCQQRVATFAQLIGDAGANHELDPFLLAAVAVRESGMDPQAVGQAGERGIVQLHPRGSGSRIRFVRSEAFRRRCARRPDHCQDEVLDAGARLLSSSIDRCGGIREGLGAYNRGVCGETSYSTRIMNERQRLLRLAKSDARSIHDVD